jgi:hypothetical protein
MSAETVPSFVVNSVYLSCLAEVIVHNILTGQAKWLSISTLLCYYIHLSIYSLRTFLYLLYAFPNIDEEDLF